jgi:hypothetical protein
MGRRYAVQGAQNVAGEGASIDSVLGITSTTAIRPRLYDIIFGSYASPADNAIQWFLQRNTAAGTGDAVTPAKLDPGDPAATATSLANHTVEPTYTAGEILLNIVANQRSTQRWVAAPGGELVAPATASNGLGLQPAHASFTGLVEATFHFEE